MTGLRMRYFIFGDLYKTGEENVGEGMRNEDLNHS